MLLELVSVKRPNYKNKTRVEVVEGETFNSGTRAVILRLYGPKDVFWKLALVDDPRSSKKGI